MRPKPDIVNRKDCRAMSKNQFRKRMINIGFRFRDATLVAKWYDKNLSARGAVGAIDFFKRVGAQLHFAVTGVGCDQPWVARRGPRHFPAIFSNMDYPDHFWLRMCKFARTIVLKEITTEQVDKVYNAIVTPYNGSSVGLANLLSFVKTGVDSLPLVSPKFQSPPLVTQQFRRVMSSSGSTPVVDESPILESLAILALNPELRLLPWWREVLHPLSPDSVENMVSIIERQFETSTYDNLAYLDEGCVGHYGYAQEGAGKLRAFASPYTVVQCLLDPIAQYLGVFIKRLGTDCTFDQEKGVRWAQSEMQSHKTVFSVDLSTATCRFPLEPQIEVLRACRLSEPIIRALEFVTRGFWSVHKDFKPFNVPDYLTWSVGQPLGISPSIRMFSLTHNILLAGICKSLGLNPLKCYRVLGDDVVISNRGVAEAYINVCTEAGIPISLNKSWESDSFAEFAGYQITRTNAVRPGQWQFAHELNHLGLSEHLGVPLKGETNQLYLQAEKLNLFRLGKFTPPPAELSVYLKVNYLMDGWEDFLGIDITFGSKQNVKYWFDEIKTVIYDQLPKPLHVYIRWSKKYVATVNAVIDLLPSGIFVNPEVLDGSHSWGCILVETWLSIRHSPLSLIEQKELFDQVLTKMKSFLWAPPISVSKEIKTQTKNLLKKLMTSLEHTSGSLLSSEQLKILESFENSGCDTSFVEANLIANAMGFYGDHVFWGLSSFSGPLDEVSIAEYLYSIGAM